MVQHSIGPELQCGTPLNSVLYKPTMGTIMNKIINSTFSNISLPTIGALNLDTYTGAYIRLAEKFCGNVRRPSFSENREIVYAEK